MLDELIIDSISFDAIGLTFSGYSYEDAVQVAVERSTLSTAALRERALPLVFEAVLNILADYDSFVSDKAFLPPGELLVQEVINEWFTRDELRAVVRKHCFLDWSLMSVNEIRSASIGLSFQGPVIGRYSMRDFVVIGRTASDRSFTKFLLSTTSGRFVIDR